MRHSKIYLALLLPLGLSLAGCGSDSGSSSGGNAGQSTSTLSVENSIADITLVGDTALNFSIPTDLCTDSSGSDISYQITGLNDNVGFTLTNFTQLTGLANDVGEVAVTVTCSTTSESETDSFTITVVDYEADPTVTASAPSSADAAEQVTLSAVAEDTNLAGSIVSYSWIETSGLGITLTNANTATATFTAPDTTTQTAAEFEVTVTDDDGSTAVDTVEVELISTLAAKASISFPLAAGQYSQDTLNVFGNVEATSGHAVSSVLVKVDDVDYPAVVAGDTWRATNVSLADDAEITVLTTTTDGFISYETLSFDKDTFYVTDIDDHISDIAVNESTGDIYVHSDGQFIADLHITKFNLGTGSNEELSYTKDATYGNDVRSSIATDGDNLYLSSPTAITKIDLSTNIETVLSDANTDINSTAPEAILDLGYNSISDELYFIDLNTLEINTVNTTTGDRTNNNPTTGIQAVSVATASNGFTYYAQGQNTTGAVNIYALTSNAPVFEVIHSIDSPANGANGGPVSDLALNEADNELYFIDGAGDLIKLDLDTDPTAVTSSTLLTGLFSVESITGFVSPLIGLHYDTTRNVIIAAGRDTDGTNKLLVIDPVTGDYAKVATGTVD